MGVLTKIQWAHHTFNPWIGCAKVSPGCEHCYAEADMDHRRHMARWGVQGTRHVTSAGTWRSPLKWDREARALGERRRVFCASLADVFEDREDLAPIRDRLFGLVAATPRLDWLMLTKRPEVASKYFLRENRWGASEAFRDLMYGPDSDVALGDGLKHWPPSNVWLGVSVEDQRRADERIPVLLDIRASVRFLSVEPLLGPIWFPTLRGIDWVIIGGESGPKARPCDIEWIDGIIAQCRAHGVAPFVKQLGSHVEACDIIDAMDYFPGTPRLSAGKLPHCARVHLKDPKGGDPDEWPRKLRIREFPAIAAGYAG